MIYDDLKGNPEKVLLMSRYSLSRDQEVFEKMVKGILRKFKKEVKEGTLEYIREEDDGMSYFLLYWT